MFIFSSDSKKNEKVPVARNNDIETVIGKNSAIVGDITAGGNIRFDGRIDGNISATGHVVIGPSGIINGNISASSLDVAGTITGNIDTNGNLTIHSTGQLIGDVRVKSLNIADGGVFKGRSEMDVHTPIADTTAPTYEG